MGSTTTTIQTLTLKTTTDVEIATKIKIAIEIEIAAKVAAEVVADYVTNLTYPGSLATSEICHFLNQKWSSMLDIYFILILLDCAKYFASKVNE